MTTSTDNEAKRLPVLHRLTKEEFLAEALIEAQRQLEIYEGIKLSNIDLLSPQDSIGRLNREIANAHSMHEISTLQRRVADLHTISAEATMRAQKLCRKQFQPARFAILVACDRALALLDDYLQEAHSDEESLFAPYGLKRQQTEVSRRVEAVIAQVKAMKHGLLDTSPASTVVMVPSHKSHVMEFFAKAAA